MSSTRDIRYNYLNLPKEIRFNDKARRMKNIYDAAGNKPAKILEADDNGKAPLVKETRHYVGNFVYKTDTAGNMSLQYILNEEGKITFDSLDNPVYEYFIKDHLGNTRAVVAIGEDGMDTLQTTDYYPYGMIMGGRNEQPGKEDNKYLFGCKEMVNDFGSFSIYYFGARDYDARLGRWYVVDNKAGKYVSITTYAYAANNPILFIDPNGNEIVFASNVSNTFKRKVNTRMFIGRIVSREARGIYKSLSNSTKIHTIYDNSLANEFNSHVLVSKGDYYSVSKCRWEAQVDLKEWKKENPSPLPDIDPISLEDKNKEKNIAYKKSVSELYDKAGGGYNDTKEGVGSDTYLLFDVTSKGKEEVKDFGKTKGFTSNLFTSIWHELIHSYRADQGNASKNLETKENETVIQNDIIRKQTYFLWKKREEY